jgi:hypothetical protein
MNRDKLKSAIKKIILKEITINSLGGATTDHSDDDAAVAVLDKAVGKEGKAMKPIGSSNVAAETPEHQVKLYKQGGDSYDVISVTNGSDRRTAKGLKLEDVSAFLKKHVDDTTPSYTDKARDKALGSYGKKIADVDEKKTVGVKVDDTDKMEDVKVKTQKEISDKDDKKAGEKFVKDVAPVTDEVAPQLGGELVDKIEAIIDKALKTKNRVAETPKDKAEPKKPFLKADKSKESPDKLEVKIKNQTTSDIKDKKKWPDQTPASSAIEKDKK